MSKLLVYENDDHVYRLHLMAYTVAAATSLASYLSESQQFDLRNNFHEAFEFAEMINKNNNDINLYIEPHILAHGLVRYSEYLNTKENWDITRSQAGYNKIPSFGGLQNGEY